MLAWFCRYFAWYGVFNISYFITHLYFRSGHINDNTAIGADARYWRVDQLTLLNVACIWFSLDAFITFGCTLLQLHFECQMIYEADAFTILRLIYFQITSHEPAYRRVATALLLATTVTSCFHSQRHTGLFARSNTVLINLSWWAVRFSHESKLDAADYCIYYVHVLFTDDDIRLRSALKLHLS